MASESEAAAGVLAGCDTSSLAHLRAAPPDATHAFSEAEDVPPTLVQPELSKPSTQPEQSLLVPIPPSTPKREHMEDGAPPPLPQRKGTTQIGDVIV